MKKLNQRGITLIALVITIIVLLILAGVSIAMLTGQNGILAQAQKAKTTTDNKSAEEKVKLAVMAARSQSETGALEADKLVTEVTTNYGGQAETTAGGFPVTVTIDGKSFTVDENGTVELSGAKPQVTEAKVVTSADGTGNEAADDQAEGTTLYISFKASLENGTISSVTCDKGTVENKNGIYVTKVTANGTYTFTITGTGENGELTSTIPIKVSKYETSILSASDIAAKTDKTKIYGAKVTGYTLPSGTTTDVGWKIFYADNSNIYLIADNYVERTNLPGSTGGTTSHQPNDGNSSYARTAYFSNILNDYVTGSARVTDNKLKALNNDYFNTKGFTSTNPNMKSVAYMMDTTAWNSKFKGNKAEYAIGGPTVELLFKSHKGKYGTTYESQAIESSDKTNTGYQIRKTSKDTWANYVSSMLTTNDSLYVITSQTNALAYWLASPSAGNTNDVMNVNYDGNVNNGNYDDNSNGFRPLVCLQSNVTLEKVSDTEYAIQ